MQQYAEFETVLYVILLTQKNVNQKFTQGTKPFPNLDKTVYQLSELDVRTRCPDVTDTYSVQVKFINTVVLVHTIPKHPPPPSHPTR